MLDLEVPEMGKWGRAFVLAQRTRLDDTVVVRGINRHPELKRKRLTPWCLVMLDIQGLVVHSLGRTTNDRRVVGHVYYLCFLTSIKRTGILTSLHSSFHDSQELIVTFFHTNTPQSTPLIPNGNLLKQDIQQYIVPVLPPCIQCQPVQDDLQLPCQT